MTISSFVRPVFLGGVLMSAVGAILGPTNSEAATLNVTTHLYNTGRTGWNSVETILTPTSVTTGNFGVLAAIELDEQVDAQPLLIGNILISGQTKKHNVLYVATENNTIYAIDAVVGTILLSRNLGTPVGAATTGNCTANSSNIGIGSTPAISTANSVMYVITDTLEAGAPVFRLHALKLIDLTDAVPSVIINPTHKVGGSTVYAFNPYVTHQRSALLLANGNVYAGFASYCDFSPDLSRGWLLGWNATTLEALAANEMPNTKGSSKDEFFLTSIWMSGSGPAADSPGNVWFVTGNSDPDGTSFSSTNNLAESVVKVSPDLSKVEKFFTPYDWSLLDQSDYDFGSGGIMILPQIVGYPYRLAVAAGKDGNMYLMSVGAPGGLVKGGPNNVLDTHYITECWCAETYFTGTDGVNRVVSSGGNTLQSWQIVMNPSPHLVADSWTQFVQHVGQDGGFFTTVSSKGNQNAIIWAVARPDGSNNNAIYLDAYDPNNGGNNLVGNVIAGHWPNTQANANVVPVVSNGKVYVASYGQVVIFGLGATGKVTPLAKQEMSLQHAAAKQTLALHTLYGTIKEIEGTTIRLETRAGKTVTVDASEAFRKHHATVGAEKIIVLGSYGATGILHAVSIGRAKNHVESWGPDR